jgi:predicted amidohydrolase YtcJ
MHPELILIHGKFTTLDPSLPDPEAVAIRSGRFGQVGSEEDVMRERGRDTLVIDLQGRRAIPGLIDSHTHAIRGGLSYTMELRWDGVRSLDEAMRMLKEQVARTPAPQWVRVVGGFTEYQFAEKRLPTVAELNRVAPDTPVFILHLYDRAILNGAALRSVGYTRDTPDPPGGAIARDRAGNPTGLLLARPNAALLYATLSKGPKLPVEYQKNSTRHFLRELNRLGITSVIDAGGGAHTYPEDYEVVEALHREGRLTVRVAYNLFSQKPSEELAEFAAWTSTIRRGQGDDFYRHNGAGEMLVYSAADFEDFRVERPDLPPTMEGELEGVVRLLAQNGWPWRMHATYDETISRALDVFEKVDRDVPLAGINWFFDHAETISDRNIDRVARLGGGIAVQQRMAYQGEDFIERYGARAAQRTPPIRRMLELGVRVGGGTDATRVASYNPWVSLAWLVGGKTVGGTVMYPPGDRLGRMEALRLWTEANTWFSAETGKKGAIRTGQLADLAVLSGDYFDVPEDEIADITSVLTLLGGKAVHASDDFEGLADPLPPPMPDWSPVRYFANYGPSQRSRRRPTTIAACGCKRACAVHGHRHPSAWAAEAPAADAPAFWGLLGCSCWAF